MIKNFSNKVVSLYSYIGQRKTDRIDIYSIVNTTLIANPYVTNFPKSFIFNYYNKESKFKLFMFNMAKFYIFSFVRFVSFIQVFVYYKFLYKKPQYKICKNDLALDVFFLVDQIVQDQQFCENYFSSLYTVLQKNKTCFFFIPRLYGLSLNPVRAHKQLISFFKVINKNSNNFLFEFELFSLKDFFQLIWLILCYPFKTLRLLVKEKVTQDIIFNVHLLKDISRQSVVSFTRYILGKNISKMKNIVQIYSWSEFQVVERSFNYAIRKNSSIKINACQFYLNHPVYFNAYIQDIDEINGYAPHRVLVNGRNYLIKSEYVNYELGVSLRYKKIFNYDKQKSGTNTVVMGSYYVNETKNLLKLTKDLDNVIFKKHPATDISIFAKQITKDAQTTNKDIYDLFPEAAIVVGAASGALVEAVVCGISVIVVAREGELVTNSLVDFGKGKIWDIAFNKTELKDKCEKLLAFRDSNINEVNAIADWYKDNFFVEPTRENISKAFELNF